jgi:RimJ/RimL family protein N-acetyltransferase
VLHNLPTDDRMSLSTERLRIEPLAADDADDLFPVLDDAALGRYTGELPPDDVEALRARFERWERRRSPDGAELWLNWTVRLREDGRAIGALQASVSDHETSIAWTIGTPFQGQGFATEAADAILAWLRVMLGDATIVAWIHPDHVASQGVARRIGMRPTDRVRDGEVAWEDAPPVP